MTSPYELLGKRKLREAEIDPRAAKIMDELICMNRINLDSGMAEAVALQYIGEARRRDPQHPITMWLAEEMRKRGLIE